MNRNQVIFIGIMLFLPFIFLLLSKLDSDRALIWFMLHQGYYSLIGWIGEPFFKPDSEIMFVVKISGRILAVVVYSLLLVGFIYLKRKVFGGKYNYKAIK